MAKIDKGFRKRFVVIVQTGALTFDRKYDRRMAHHVVDMAMKIPDELFFDNRLTAYNYACDLLDFEYGLFDAANEEYPEWIKKYFKWKRKDL